MGGTSDLLFGLFCFLLFSSAFPMSAMLLQFA